MTAKTETPAEETTMTMMSQKKESTTPRKDMAMRKTMSTKKLRRTSKATPRQSIRKSKTQCLRNQKALWLSLLTKTAEVTDEVAEAVEATEAIEEDIEATEAIEEIVTEATVVIDVSVATAVVVVVTEVTVKKDHVRAIQVSFKLLQEDQILKDIEEEGPQEFYYLNVFNIPFELDDHEVHDYYKDTGVI